MWSHCEKITKRVAATGKVQDLAHLAVFGASERCTGTTTICYNVLQRAAKQNAKKRGNRMPGRDHLGERLPLLGKIQPSAV